MCINFQPKVLQDLVRKMIVYFYQVRDQQVTLEKAGVPGFYETTKPVEIQVQMHLLDFILRHVVECSFDWKKLSV